MCEISAYMWVEMYYSSGNVLVVEKNLPSSFLSN